MIFKYARQSGVVVSVEADAMDVSENGDLLFWVMSSQGDSSAMVRAIAAGEWTKAWVPDEETRELGVAGKLDPVPATNDNQEISSTRKSALDWLVETLFPRIPR